MQKRIISLFLVLVLFLGLFPAPVRAAEPDSDVESGVSIEGTNGFGHLLSAEIQAEYEAETQDTGGYSVLGLEIAGSVATVEYASMEEAVLVVALYSEDGMQLLTSGKTTVDPEEDTATVTIDGEMPEYFQASAYLVDSYDFSPLCASYDTPMYTREMQELLASTVDDYDADRVLQLDDDKTTNFAVYAEDTILIEEQAGVNTVASVNDATSTYVIENADESITSLQEGDIFAYPYGENEILIVKVASLSVSGTTATITGDELEMEEAFSYVKIETGGDTADVQMHGDTVEGVTFEGMVSDGAAPLAVDGSASAEKSLNYTLDKKLSGDAAYGEAEVKVSGSLSLKLKLDFSFYVSLQRQFFELKNETKLQATVSVSGKIAGKIPLPSFGISPIAGVYIDFSPELKLEFSGKISYSISVSVAVSVTYENSKGINFHFDPDADSKLEVEGTVFLGIDMNPNIGVAGGSILELDLSLPVGVKLEAKQAGTGITGTGKGDSIHGCEECLSMELKFEAEAEAKLQFLKWDKLSLKKKVNFNCKLADMYYSLDNSRFGWGKCPYLEYRVTIQICNDSGSASDVTVSMDGGVIGITNSQGILTVYIPAGTHHFTATIGGKACGCQTKITKAGKVTLREIGSFGEDGEGSSWDQLPGTVTDDGKYLASGTCGENAAWTLSRDGVLIISGTGPMDDWAYAEAPWYDKRERITAVEIGIGITHIGDWAFSDCDNLTEITVPFGVTSIGNRAFDSSNLTVIFLPSTLSSIGDMAFYWTNLTDVYYQGSESQWQNITIGINNDKLINATFHFDQAGDMLGSGICGGDMCWVLDNGGTLTIFGTGEMADYGGGVMPWNDYLTSITKVVIQKGVTSISQGAFYLCTNLTGIVLPDGITHMGYSAFAYCENLTDIVIPDSVTGIGQMAFGYCESLTTVTLPENLTCIDAYVFRGCYALSDMVIPQSVTTIGDYAFYGCGSLKSIQIPDSVTAIGAMAFYNCNGLTSVTIPGSVQSIGSSAFGKCQYLKKVILDDGVATIGSQAFVNCTNLASMVIPGSVTSIEWGAFNSCNKLKDIYFGGSEEQWNQLGPGISTTSATIHYNSTGPTAAAADILSTETATEDIPTLDAIYGGSYGTEELEDYTLKTASFSGLVPGEEYLLLALVDLEAEGVLAADNLLAIDQAAAGEDGRLSFTYIQRTPAEISYVMACGASGKNLNDGDITFPEMTSDDTVHAVDPAVVYEGTTLTEGTDYVLLGDVTYSEAGTYTCFVRGIRSYTGLAECSYTVTESVEEPVTPPTEETQPEDTQPTQPEDTQPTQPEDTQPTQPEDTQPTEPESTQPTQPVYDNPFVDVFEDDYYYTPVLWAVNKGITNGMDATHFAPDGTCTRAQIVTFLWRANGSPAPAAQSNPFTDVPAGQWYTDAVLWAVEKGITTGTSATTFSPDAGCTRGQVATFLWRSQGQPAVSGENIFTDIASGAYYYDAVLWAVANNITNGMGDGTFAPDATCTRGQIVTFLYRAMA